MGATSIEFEELYRDVTPIINRPIDVKLSRSHKEMKIKKPTPKASRSHIVLFFLFVLRGENEREIGHKHFFSIRISPATVSTYTKRVTNASFDGLYEDKYSEIRWLCTVEKREMCGLFCGFENCIGFLMVRKSTCLGWKTRLKGWKVKCKSPCILSIRFVVDICVGCDR